MNGHVPRLLVDAPLATGTETPLSDGQVHHLLHVMRLRAGDPVRVFNEADGEFDARIADLSRRGGRVTALAARASVPVATTAIEVAIALLKRDAMRLALEKCVELGAARITPLLTDRVSVAPRTFTERADALRAHIVGAVEQCGRIDVPRLGEPVPFREFIRQADGCRLLAHPGTTVPAPVAMAEPRVTVAIGPEGGFTETEAEAATQAGFARLSLGPRILRAETAVLAALTIVQHRYGDLR